MGEFDLINKFFLRLAKKKEALGLKDDCAVFKAPNKKIIVNTDTCIQGRHFFDEDEPKSVAHKLLETNLSDIAAMGAQAKFWTMSLSLPNDPKYNDDWFEEFSNALDKIQTCSDCYLIGGDTTATDGPLTLSATVIGFVDINQKPLRKTTAQEGDAICVSGYIGDAYFGFKVLEEEYKGVVSTLPPLLSEHKRYFINRYKFPKGRLRLGEILIQYANSCTDVSDGLWADLEKLCINSNKRGVLKLNNMAFSHASNYLFTKVKNPENYMIDAITGGGDYELVFTISKNKLDVLKTRLKDTRIFIQEIGEITTAKEPGLDIIYKNKVLSVKQKGFVHF